MADKKVEIEVIIEAANSADTIKEIKQSIKELDEAASNISIDSKEFDKLSKKSQELKDNLSGIGKAGSDAKKGLGQVSKGFKGIGIAIKLAGIGLVIALFAALKEILSKQQPILDLLDTTFNAIAITIRLVSEAIGDAWESVGGLNGGFSSTIKIIKALFTIALTPLKLIFYAIKKAVIELQLAWNMFFGDETKVDGLLEDLDEVKKKITKISDEAVDAAISIYDNIGDAIVEVVNFVGEAVDNISEISGDAILDQAKALTAFKNNAEILAAVNQGLVEKYDRQAEIQRQIRDDEFVSIEDRKAANEELGRILEEQEKAMLNNANAIVAAAAAELNANNTTENRVKLIQAQNEKLAILAQVEGFRSEQIVNATALEKESNEILQTSIDREAERSKVAADAASERLEEGKAKFQQLKDNLAKEKKSETKRLQDIINNTKKGTQARVDAEQDLLDKLQEFSDRKKDLSKDEADFAISESKRAADEKIKLAEKQAAVDAEAKAEFQAAADETVNSALLAATESRQAKLDEELQDIQYKSSLEAAAIDQKFAKELAGAKGDEKAIAAINKRKLAAENKLALETFKAEEAINKASFENNKKSQLVLAGIDAAKAVITALSAAPPVIGVIPNPMSAVAQAIVAATSLANLAIITSSKYKGGRPPTPKIAPPAISVGPSSLDDGGSGDDDLSAADGNSGTQDEFIGSGPGFNQQPIYAYVVESEITANQSTIDQYEQRATL